jgi:hypothetical protein
MSEAYSARSAGGCAAVARAAADWLSFMAAPAFAVMAFMTARLGGGVEQACMGVEHGSLISGMVPMYLMMGALHSGPWLRLIAGRGR